VSKRQCPDCQVDLTPIKIIAASLDYVPPEEERSFWTGGYANVGSICAWKCPLCGWVQFYAGTERDSLPVPSQAPEPPADTLPRPAAAPEEPGSSQQPDRTGQD
jgi:hypothetical protein